jgi:hypothetical protein
MTVLHNFVDTEFNFLLQGKGGCLVGIILRIGKKPKGKKSNGLNLMSWAGNFDHQKGKLHDRKMSGAVIELFLGRYGLYGIF